MTLDHLDGVGDVHTKSKSKKKFGPIIWIFQRFSSSTQQNLSIYRGFWGKNLMRRLPFKLHQQNIE